MSLRPPKAFYNPELERIIRALRKAHEKMPDLQVGQMIGNALPVRFGRDPYYVTDRELAEVLENYAGATADQHGENNGCYAGDGE